MTRRNRAILMVCGSVALALVIYLIMWLITPDDEPATTAIDGVQTIAPQSTAEPVFTDEPTAEPSDEPSVEATPTASRTTSAPASRKPQPAPTRTTNPPTKKAGVNPHVNSSLRLEIRGGTGTMVLYASTSNAVKLEGNARLTDTNPNSGTNGNDWVIWQHTTAAGADKNIYWLKPTRGPDLDFYGAYIYNGATRSWVRVNLAKYTFSLDYNYEIVMFWNDPDKPEGDAPVPPSFNWENVDS